MEINLDYLNSLRLKLPSFDAVNMHLVGCGGTGSWLAPHVARMALMLIERFNKKVEVHFWDPDTVEPKNIFRQNFSYAEIGSNKARYPCHALRRGLGPSHRGTPCSLQVGTKRNRVIRPAPVHRLCR